MRDLRLEKKATLLFQGGCFAAFAVVAAQALAPDDDFVQSFVLFPMWCLWWVAAILSIAYIIELARRQCWSLVALLAVLLGSVSLALPAGVAFWFGDAVRFAVMKPTYDRAIHALPTHEAHIKAFPLSIAWDNAIDQYIVYDDSDEIGKPDRRRSFTWHVHAKAQGIWWLSAQCRPTKALWSHYYVVTTCGPGF